MSDGSTPAETMRRAAALMRERAEAARADLASPFWGSYSGTEADIWRLGFLNGWGGITAELAGSLHPAMVMAVAEWLDMEAHMCDQRGNSNEGNTFHALKVARAYLGEADPS